MNESYYEMTYSLMEMYESKGIESNNELFEK